MTGRNHPIKKLQFICFVLCSTVLFAQSTISLPPSFHADFKQTITNEQKKQIVYQGKIDFSSPDRFKWRYTAPTRKEVCTDSKKLLVVDHDLEQVSSYIIDKALDLVAILKGAKPHRKSVYIASYQDKYYTIQVNSRQELSRIAYKDDLDNTVLIVFSRMKYGKKEIPAAQMKCDYPERYDWVGG